MLRLFMSFAFIYNIYGLIVSKKYIGANAGNKLLKYNNKLNLDDKISCSIESGL